MSYTIGQPISPEHQKLIRQGRYQLVSNNQQLKRVNHEAYLDAENDRGNAFILAQTVQGGRKLGLLNSCLRIQRGKPPVEGARLTINEDAGNGNLDSNMGSTSTNSGNTYTDSGNTYNDVGNTNISDSGNTYNWDSGNTYTNSGNKYEDIGNLKTGDISYGNVSGNTTGDIDSGNFSNNTIGDINSKKFSDITGSFGNSFNNAGNVR
ncbi:hypothetical protein BDV41DRAFT_573876 [Aspergillus transmontanensis]|uniref:Uncharacterized protein n=1 Tax=Aspergillus transmontanensis TaxID=1034304 RepID=A0A5N6W7H4_9EURO|nr:hypothetical protein BDV41DRAFT_573876 [Aspergillus transmontanensis]